MLVREVILIQRERGQKKNKVEKVINVNQLYLGNFIYLLLCYTLFFNGLQHWQNLLLILSIFD